MDDALMMFFSCGQCFEREFGYKRVFGKCVEIKIKIKKKLKKLKVIESATIFQKNSK